MDRRNFLHAGLRASIAAAVGRWVGLAACSQVPGQSSSATAAEEEASTFWPNLAWGDVPIGGGGYITQNAVDLNTGIMWCGTDVQNSYLRRPGDPRWATVFRSDTMPAEDMVRNAELVGGKRITDGLGSNMGTFAGRDGTRAYSHINGWAYTLDLDANIPLTKSGGIKATRWNLPVKWMRTNQGWDRWWGPGMAGHPDDKNVCLLGTENDGAYFTTDAGRTVQQIAVPACSGGIGSARGRERILVWQGRLHSFVFVQGAGLYRSSSGPTGQFDPVLGSPRHATCLYGEADGTLWMTGDPRMGNPDNTRLVSPARSSADAGVWRLDFAASEVVFVGNPLSQWGGYGPWHIAVDPHNRNNIVCFKDQLGAVSQDRGKSWDVTSSAKMVSGGEAGWRLGNMFVGDFKFTPKPGQILWGEGFGCLLTENYESMIGLRGWALTAKDYSKGIEEFIVNNILVNPRTGKVWLNCWDRHVVDVVSLADYVNRPKMPAGARLSAALGMDVAIDDDFYVVGAGSGTALHSWSQGGETFNLFDPSPSRNVVFPARPSANGGAAGTRGGSAGPVAVSTRHDIVIVQSNKWPAIETRGRFNPRTGVPDRAEDWSVVELDGSTNYSTINAFYVTRQCVSADKTRPGVMAMVVPMTNGATRKYDNPLGGLWVRPSTDKPWAQTVQGVVGGKGELSQFWVCHLNYIPGRTGELLYTGYIGQAHCPLVHLVDDGLKEVLIPDVTDVIAFGFGRNPAPAKYPAVLFRGKYRGVEAFWLTLDWFKTVHFASDLFPNNYWSAGTPSIAGDLSGNGFGKWLISIGGKGAVFARLDNVGRA